MSDVFDRLADVHRGWCNFCKGNVEWCRNAPAGGCSLRDYERELSAVSETGASVGETPRTDAAEADNSEFSDWGTGPSGYVKVDFARTLERELADSKEYIEGVEGQLRKANEAVVGLKQSSATLASIPKDSVIIQEQGGTLVIPPGPLATLGKRLTELLDDDKWSSVEPLLVQIGKQLAAAPVAQEPVIEEGAMANVSITLKADSGYECEESHRINSWQWGCICKILNDPNAAPQAAVPEARPTPHLTDEQIVDALRRSGATEVEWRNLTYDSGPYEITKPLHFVRRFVGEVLKDSPLYMNSGELSPKKEK